MKSELWSDDNCFIKRLSVWTFQGFLLLKSDKHTDDTNSWKHFSLIWPHHFKHWFGFLLFLKFLTTNCILHFSFTWHHKQLSFPLQMYRFCSGFVSMLFCRTLNVNFYCWNYSELKHRYCLEENSWLNCYKSCFSTDLDGEDCCVSDQERFDFESLAESSSLVHSTHCCCLVSIDVFPQLLSVDKHKQVDFYS